MSAKTEVSDDCLLALEKRDEELRFLKKMRHEQAAAVTMTYAPGRTDGITLDGVPLRDRERKPIPDGAALEIDRLGRLDIHPGRKADDPGIAEAEAVLSAALSDAGFRGMEGVRESASRRRRAEERRRDAEAELAGVAPKGIDALREEIAELPRPVDPPDNLPSVDEAQEREAVARGSVGGS